MRFLGSDVTLERVRAAYVSTGTEYADASWHSATGCCPLGVLLLDAGHVDLLKRLRELRHIQACNLVASLSDGVTGSEVDIFTEGADGVSPEPGIEVHAAYVLGKSLRRALFTAPA